MEEGWSYGCRYNGRLKKDELNLMNMTTIVGNIVLEQEIGGKMFVGTYWLLPIQ